MKRLLVIGGGFAGFWSAVSAVRQARELKKTNDLEVVVISKDDFHSIKPRFHDLSLEFARVPLRKYFESLNVELIVGEVNELDPEGKKISLSNRQNDIAYDNLILAAGSRVRTAGVPGIENAFNVDTFEAASKLKQHLENLSALGFKSEASRNVVIVGGGLTGIEVATTIPERIAELAGSTAGFNFYMVDKGTMFASNYPKDGCEIILKQFQKLGINIFPGEEVKQIECGKITLSNGKTVETETVIWTAGLEACPLTSGLKSEKDEIGRLYVDEFLCLGAYGNIFAAGDVAKAKVDEHNYAYMSCQHAMPQGKYAGHNSVNQLFGEKMKPYAQPQYATCLDLGTDNALFTFGWDRQVRSSGPDAKKLKTQIVTQWIYPSPDVEETIKMSVPNVPSF